MARTEGVPSVSVEAGHIYAPARYRLSTKVKKFDDSFQGRQPREAVDTTIDQGLQIARLLRQKLQDRGIDVKQLLFVDDVSLRERQKTSSNPERWELFIQRTARQIVSSDTEPERVRVLSEHSFIEEAEKIIGQIRQKAAISTNYRLSSNGNAVIVGHGKSRRSVRLVGYNREYPTLPSCEVLDVCVYQKKLKDDRETITVLPVEYKAQQEKVRLLLELLTEDELPVTVIFFDKMGSVVEVRQWHRQESELGRMIGEVLAELYPTEITY